MSEYSQRKYSDLGEMADFRRLLQDVSAAVNMADNRNIDTTTRLRRLDDVGHATKAFAEAHKGDVPPKILRNLTADLRWMLDRAKDVAAFLERGREEQGR
ncbi:MAG: hypothetical protein QW756_06730 [Nitrososphaerota archaeon]